VYLPEKQDQLSWPPRDKCKVFIWVCL